jgi:hypothetical protein
MSGRLSGLCVNINLIKLVLLCRAVKPTELSANSKDFRFIQRFSHISVIRKDLRRYIANLNLRVWQKYAKIDVYKGKIENPYYWNLAHFNTLLNIT